MGLLRFFHTGFRYQSSGTSAMAVLRKKTGYGLSSIRKALELNENDIEKAEKWLIEQAKALGWSKVAKVQGRTAVQGLIGVMHQNKKLTMVEVNCETDFVSRNDKFLSFVELVTRTCFQQPVLTSGLETQQVVYSSEELKNLQVDNVSLADKTALLVGSLGENAVLKRAFCYETSRNDVLIEAAVHPYPENESDILLGKYGAFIAYQCSSDAPSDVSNVVKDICTHIIGTNPVKIGEYGKDEPSENGNEESVLIHQDFLLNESLTVGQLITNCGITLLDFKRFQCGESSATENTDSSDSKKNE